MVKDKMCTKTSHHSLRMTTAGINNTDCLQSLLSSVMNVAVGFQCFLSDAWGVVIVY